MFCFCAKICPTIKRRKPIKNTCSPLHFRCISPFLFSPSLEKRPTVPMFWLRAEDGLSIKPRKNACHLKDCSGTSWVFVLIEPGSISLFFWFGSWKKKNSPYVLLGLRNLSSVHMAKTHGFQPVVPILPIAHSDFRVRKSLKKLNSPWFLLLCKKLTPPTSEHEDRPTKTLFSKDNQLYIIDYPIVGSCNLTKSSTCDFSAEVINHTNANT